MCWALEFWSKFGLRQKVTVAQLSILLGSILDHNDMVLWFFRHFLSQSCVRWRGKVLRIVMCSKQRFTVSRLDAMSRVCNQEGVVVVAKRMPLVLGFI